MKVTIKILQVLSGDAITINYPGPDGQYRNIFIDGGFAGTYRRTLKKEISGLVKKKQDIDLFVITHVDQDHIGGVLSFIKDFRGRDPVKEYWFNWSAYGPGFPEDDPKVSISQGISLRDYLQEQGRLKAEFIHSQNQPVDLHGARLTLLSPDPVSLRKFREYWDKEEKKKFFQPISAKGPDYHGSIAELAAEKFEEDNRLANRNSIAFLFQFKGKKVLFLADAHPSVVRESLENMGYSPDNKLKADYVKISHHGSKYNTDDLLTRYLDCSDFIVSANGMNKHYLPHKEAFARILTNPDRGDKKIRFIFNYNNETLRSIFSREEQETYNFECSFPEEGEHGARIEF